MLAVTLAMVYSASGDSESVSLIRKYREGERAQYAVTGTLLGQARDASMDKALPEDISSSYKFTTEVVKVLADGSAQIHYKRPTISETFGETYDSPPRTNVQKQNMDFLLTLSPVNEVIDQKKTGNAKVRFSRSTQEAQGPQDGFHAFMDEFMPDYIRLCGFTGSFDWALDLAPKLPLTPVKIGDTWTRTIGYQPQQKGGKQVAVQRVDTIYTYKGILRRGDKQFVRISTTLKMDSDIASWANRITDGATDLQKMVVKLDAEVDFDLEPSTLRTVRAEASSHGFVLAVPNLNAQDGTLELKFDGNTELKLLGVARDAPIGRRAAGRK